MTYPESLDDKTVKPVGRIVSFEQIISDGGVHSSHADILSGRGAVETGRSSRSRQSVIDGWQRRNSSGEQQARNRDANHIDKTLGLLL